MLSSQPHVVIVMMRMKIIESESQQLASLLNEANKSHVKNYVYTALTPQTDD